MNSKSPTPDPFHHEQPPLLVVISGPSGVGKDSVVQRMKERGFPVHFVVTATDRPPRPNEVHGRDYYFYTTAEFEQLIARGELLEHARVYDELYGTPLEPVARARRQGIKLLLNIDPQGARSLQQQGVPARYIFVMPPSLEVLRQRLVGRRTDDAAEIAKRLARAEAEMAQADHYDHVVVNDLLERAVAELKEILQ